MWTKGSSKRLFAKTLRERFVEVPAAVFAPIDEPEVIVEWLERRKYDGEAACGEIVRDEVARQDGNPFAVKHAVSNRRDRPALKHVGERQAIAVPGGVAPITE